jgi:hypothetical protein
MSALDELRNKRGIHTPIEACILIAGESTIAKEAAAELQALREAVEAGLREAVTALYFRDSSDFGPALWSIVKRLGGEEAAELLETDEEAAYLKYVKPKGE